MFFSVILSYFVLFCDIIYKSHIRGGKMNKEEKIINIAVVAHVDVGKSTLVDALLSHVMR